MRGALGPVATGNLPPGYTSPNLRTSSQRSSFRSIFPTGLACTYMHVTGRCPLISYFQLLQVASHPGIT